MSCAKFHEELMAVAAGERPMSAALQSHLANCAACAAVLVRERELFGAIDSGLRLAANVLAPGSVYSSLPALAARPSGGRTRAGVRRTAVLAMAATALIAVFVGQPWRYRQPAAVESVVTAPVAAVDTAPPPPLTSSPVTKAGQAAAHAGRRKDAASRRSPADRRQMNAGAAGEPEILVPPDQEVLLARYVSALSRRASGLTASKVEPAPEDTLQVDLILIAELDVKPLAEQ